VPNLRLIGTPHRVCLTDVTISKLPQSKAQVSYWDEGLPAFGVRVGARRKTFVVIVKLGRRIKLANYLSNDDAQRGAQGSAQASVRSERTIYCGGRTYGA
jgi:hypothetical protein